MWDTVSEPQKLQPRVEQPFAKEPKDSGDEYDTKHAK